MSEESPDESRTPEHDPAEEAHLADIPDGCGCVEVWEELSERRMARERGQGRTDST